ncbi:hypothetical protein [Kitasatospora sp. NPDC088346]|uniref:hypothetical protein n=1 Tax=Kitasatospora sp. NPDC088346 TaxID=3364073 RepID=UPI0037F8E9BA
MEAVARLAVDTGITFALGDIVDAVERDLPPTRRRRSAAPGDHPTPIAQSIILAQGQSVVVRAARVESWPSACA